MKKDVIIACDFKSKEELFTFLKPFEGYNPYLKIGMELFYKEGPSLVRELKEKGFRIFLDLKLCDIPNTVYAAMEKLGTLGVEFVNVHAFGGIEMMKKAREGLNATEAGKKTKLIAVTVLTSIDDEVLSKQLLIDKPVKEVVRQYAMNTKEAGLDGVVCSALEAGMMKEMGLLSLTPGIRLAGDSKDDQKRVATPALAKKLGSDYIIVGRSITKAKDPLKAYNQCMEEFN